MKVLEVDSIAIIELTKFTDNSRIRVMIDPDLSIFQKVHLVDIEGLPDGFDSEIIGGVVKLIKKNDIILKAYLIEGFDFPEECKEGVRYYIKFQHGKIIKSSDNLNELK